MIEVFCDGSLTNSRLDGVYESSVGPLYVGRAIVVSPGADLGFIAQSQDGMLTEDGMPASENAEIFAIHVALDLCRRHGLFEVVVYSDCRGAVRRFPDAPVEWRDRDQMRLPNDFFDKILRRRRYLKKTEGKVRRRRPPEAHQIEIFELFNAQQHEFRLSESPLWRRICSDAGRHPQTLGVGDTDVDQTGPRVGKEHP